MGTGWFSPFSALAFLPFQRVLEEGFFQERFNGIGGNYGASASGLFFAVAALPAMLELESAESSLTSSEGNSSGAGRRFSSAACSRSVSEEKEKISSGGCGGVSPDDGHGDVRVPAQPLAHVSEKGWYACV